MVGMLPLIRSVAGQARPACYARPDETVTKGHEGVI